VASIRRFLPASEWGKGAWSDVIDRVFTIGATHCPHGEEDVSAEAEAQSRRLKAAHLDHAMGKPSTPPWEISSMPKFQRPNHLLVHPLRPTHLTRSPQGAGGGNLARGSRRLTKAIWVLKTADVFLRPEIEIDEGSADAEDHRVELFPEGPSKPPEEALDDDPIPRESRGNCPPRFSRNSGRLSRDDLGHL
jgi:hypothetical protein